MVANVPPAAARSTAMERRLRLRRQEARLRLKLLADAAKSPAKLIAVIDVRTPEEFAESHLKGAQNVDIASPDFAKNLAKLDPSNTSLVHCAAGGRSTRSLSVLEKLGFKSIIHLDGGLNSWKKAGLPLEKPAASPAPAK